MIYVIGIILIGVGVVVVWKTNAIMQMMGRNAWAEDKLGPGGTWTFYKLLGVGIIFFAFFLMSGVVTKVLDFLFVRG